MEKVLVFMTNNSRDYWFKYVINRLKKGLDGRGIYFKTYLSSKEIWFNGNRIMFVTTIEIDEKFKAGRHDALFIFNMENKLEMKFEETLKEIFLDRKSGN